MTRLFRCSLPGDPKYITDYEILLVYWLYWSQKVFERRPDNIFNITPDDCIDDWCNQNGAQEIHNSFYLKKINGIL